MHPTIPLIAGFGLPHHSFALQGPFEDSEWRTVLEAISEQRVLGLALAACEAGVLLLGPVQRDQLLARCEAAMASVLQLEAMLAEVSQDFANAEIDSRVLKGSATARLDYPDVQWREFGDVDVMVHGADFGAATRILERHGCQRRFGEPRPGFTARFGKGACFVAPNGLEIDLHRSFVAGPFAALGDDVRLWLDAETFLIGDTRLRALPRELRLVHAALHAVLGKLTPRLVPLRDVAQIASVTDHEPVIALAHQLDVASVLARAVLQASSIMQLQETVQLDALARWAFSYQPTRRQRQMVRVYTNAQRSYLGQVRAGVRAVPGVANKVSYARALLLPDREYLASRDESYRRRLLRAVGRGRPQ